MKESKKMADELNAPTPVTKKYLKSAALTLTKAFQDYPESVYLMPEAIKRYKHLYRMYRVLLKGAITYGEVFATSLKMEGVAVWQRVDGKYPVWGRNSFWRWWWLSLFVDKETRNRQRVYFGNLSEIRKHAAPECYWYLQVLGVDPAYQGHGFSSRLLIPILERADREGLPCYLETQLDKNIPIYEHFGFKVVEEGIITGTNVYCWAMVREGKKG